MSKLEDGFQNGDDISFSSELLQSKKTLELLETDDGCCASHEAGDGGMR